MGAGKKIETGVSIAARLVASGFAVLVAVGGVAAGQPLAVVLAVAYLIYLWVFGGRWIIY